MLCPRDRTELLAEPQAGIQIDRCPACNGRWLDHHELDLLEAKTAPDPESRKGMIDYARRDSDLDCPVCGKRMVAFNYRANPLELDMCDDEHGFWLDAGEEGRVSDLIDERVRALDRAASAEQAWGDFLKNVGGGGDGWRNRFRGRR